MSPTTPKSGKKPSLGDTLALHSVRKTASCEPLGKDAAASSDEDSNRGGGARFETASDILSPFPNSRLQAMKLASDGGTPRSNRSSTFMAFGSADDGDVFTDGSNEDTCADPRGNDATNLTVYSDGRNKVDPQTMYAGSACMFVANLPQHFSDNELEEEVTRVFGRFGTVFVKIKRDGRHMPFAFCQYRFDDEAQRAMREGKGAMILGRPCRTEMARAQSSFIVYKHSGQRTRHSEAADLLGRLGEISKTDFLEEGLRVAAGLPQAVIVTYKMYDAKRDPPRVFATDPTFCVKVFDPKTLAHNGTASAFRPRERGFLQQYDKDRRSVYMGNLPPTITKDVLQSLASSCGRVLEVQLHCKDVPGMNGQKTCFAFVEFARPDAPDELIEAMNKPFIDDYCIRVERKESRIIDTPRRAAPAGGPSRHAQTLTRRPRVGSFELEKPSDHHTVTTTGVRGPPGRRTQYASNSFTPGRTRQPRPSILGDSSSSGRGLFDAPVGHRAISDLNSDLQGAGSHTSQLSAKKSVDFDLSHRVVSNSSVESDNSVAEARSPTKTGTQNNAAATPSSSHPGTLAAAPSTEMMSPYSMVPWVPYPPQWAYPYMAAPLSPQASPPGMYPGYMPQAMYPGFDMFNPVMFSPGPMMPTFPGLPGSTGAPNNHSNNSHQADESNSAADGNNSESKNPERPAQ
ncbi:Nucleotide-binding, alpha-beta plait [Purpureocillium lilacinum]|uniref:Nucleotide-binding, alpha-beta plait n=1 Tax=Purpureocillium lilacinum TaxID=33203 RepID=A0A2U3E958_PURLI|nr:Nucleotide-binding, alpha-beta plait [Purpureocillium lilacinum]